MSSPLDFSKEEKWGLGITLVLCLTGIGLMSAFPKKINNDWSKVQEQREQNQAKDRTRCFELGGNEWNEQTGCSFKRNKVNE